MGMRTSACDRNHGPKSKTPRHNATVAHAHHARPARLSRSRHGLASRPIWQIASTKIRHETSTNEHRTAWLSHWMGAWLAEQRWSMIPAAALHAARVQLLNMIAAAHASARVRGAWTFTALPAYDRNACLLTYIDALTGGHRFAGFAPRRSASRSLLTTVDSRGRGHGAGGLPPANNVAEAMRHCLDFAFLLFLLLVFLFRGFLCLG
jgi:hypothetical protein